MALSDPPQSDIPPPSPVRRREVPARRGAQRRFALGVAAAQAINGRGPADCRFGSGAERRGGTHPLPAGRGLGGSGGRGERVEAKEINMVNNHN